MHKGLRVAGTVLLWLITLLQAFQFAAAGISKFDSHSSWSRMFAHWGLPHWFQLAIGAEEAIAAVLLLIPRTARYGAMLVVATMIGAIAVRTGHGEFMHLEREIIPIVFATIIFIARHTMAKRQAAVAAPAAGD